MININDKQWNKLRLTDIQKLLEQDDDETFFFEYKNDDVTPKKVIEEISAFANTYGGYILLGIDDDKNISGCTKWTEQRIHTTIHDSITPIPNFDIKKFKTKDNAIIFVIRIEEGTTPPYITNTGKVYERVSSGSFPIKDSTKLTQLYYKREDQYRKIENKISLDKLEKTDTIPNNFCGYLDVGFSLNLRDTLKLQKLFFNANIDEIVNILKESNNKYNVTKIGYSLVISLGERDVSRGNQKLLSPSSMHNFIEIMTDGSVKFRVVIISEQDTNVANIGQILFSEKIFEDIYKIIFAENFSKNFISAYKYEHLVVLKQFVPSLKLNENDPYYGIFEKYNSEHIKKYGGNIIIASDRIPKNGLRYIDKKYFSDYNLRYNSNSIIEELFYTAYGLLGYIDKFPNIDKED